MTDQVFIASKYANSTPYEMENGVGHTGIRIYRESPFTLRIQIISKTTKQRRISDMPVTAKEAREIAEYLLRKADELTDDPGRS